VTLNSIIHLLANVSYMCLLNCGRFICVTVSLCVCVVIVSLVVSSTGAVDCLE